MFVTRETAVRALGLSLAVYSSLIGTNLAKDCYVKKVKKFVETNARELYGYELNEILEFDARTFERNIKKLLISGCGRVSLLPTAGNKRSRPSRKLSFLCTNSFTFLS